MTKKAKPRGRPALGVSATNVRLTEEIRERIRARVGDRGMAQYIRDAVEEKLDRDETEKPKS